MKRTMLLAACCLVQQATATEPVKLTFDTYGGYFVSNKFEPDAAKSFVVINDQEQFDKVFGVAFVMGDKSRRLPKDAFKSLMVIASNNYYIARMNPLEDNYRVYKVVAGKRIQLGSVDIKISSGEWHTLRVVHEADHIQCYLDGKPHLDIKDDTFKEAGKIGLWTKADAQTYFANMKVKRL